MVEKCYSYVPSYNLNSFNRSLERHCFLAYWRRLPTTKTCLFHWNCSKSLMLFFSMTKKVCIMSTSGSKWSLKSQCLFSVTLLVTYTTSKADLMRVIKDIVLPRIILASRSLKSVPLIKIVFIRLTIVILYTAVLERLTLRIDFSSTARYVHQCLWEESSGWEINSQSKPFKNSGV